MAFFVTGCSSKDDASSADSSNAKKSESASSSSGDASDGAAIEDINYADYVSIGGYSSIELKSKDVDSRTESQIASNIKKTGKYGKLKKGKVKSGDVVNIYYVGKIDGKKFDGGSCTKEDTPDGYDLEIGSNSFIDGFEDALIGKSIGKTCDINVNFPKSYPQNEELEGKPAVFTVTINYKAKWPKLTDEFVEKNFKDFEDGYKNTAADYAKYVRSGVVEDMAWEYVYDRSKIKDYPKERLEDVKTQYVTPITYYLKTMGSDIDSYLDAMGMTSEDFDRQVDGSAKEDLGKRLIFEAIAEKENLKIEDSQYEKVLGKYLEEYKVDDEIALDDLFKEYYGATAEVIINNEINYSNVKKFLAGRVKEVDG